MVPSLENAVLVDQYRTPGPTAEGVEVTIRHLSGITVKYERYEDAMRGVAVHPSPEDLHASISYTGKMKITLYGQDDQTVGEVEKIILEEIGRK